MPRSNLQGGRTLSCCREATYVFQGQQLYGVLHCRSYELRERKSSAVDVECFGEHPLIRRVSLDIHPQHVASISPAASGTEGSIRYIFTRARQTTSESSWGCECSC